ncbi:MAG: glycoside hydrolase family 18 protein [Rhodoblastus sp.]|uniref:glycoside hydrolase family 18 protein n=1 Tax=Rhodoblastus sp. TaxID=1962975 RepID=UPI003F9A9C2A
MKHAGRTAFACFLAAFPVLWGIAEAAAESAPSDRAVVAYLASWKLWSGEKISAIPASRLTHLVYAFGGVTAERTAALADPCVDIGECREGDSPSGPGGAFARLIELKRAHPGLRVLIALGGWTGSKYFSTVAATEESRKRFAESVIQTFFSSHSGVFDGVDIDWEYPGGGGAAGNIVSPSDGDHLTSLMYEMRRQLDLLGVANDRRYELSLAAPADRDKAVSFAFHALSGIVDRIEAMTYDYYAGASVAGLNAPLFASKRLPGDEPNVDASVRMLLASGVPQDKLTLGLPFYAHVYRNVGVKDDGLGQPAESGAPPEWGGLDTMDYQNLVALRPAENGFGAHRDPDARVPWLYNPHTRIWISYDDPESIKEKARYARKHALAGVMIWDIGADDGKLLPAALDGLIGKAAAER